MDRQATRLPRQQLYLLCNIALGDIPRRQTTDTCSRRPYWTSSVRAFHPLSPKGQGPLDGKLPDVTSAAGRAPARAGDIGWINGRRRPVMTTKQAVAAARIYQRTHAGKATMFSRAGPFRRQHQHHTFHAVHLGAGTATSLRPSTAPRSAPSLRDCAQTTGKAAGYGQNNEPGHIRANWLRFRCSCGGLRTNWPRRQRNFMDADDVCSRQPYNQTRADLVNYCDLANMSMMAVR